MTELAALYARLRPVKCKGLCTESCGPIGMHPAEVENVREKYGGLPVVDETLVCSELHEGRCGIYPVRPLICRAWGVVKVMRCPFGCKPDGSFVSDATLEALYDELMRLKPGPVYMSLTGEFHAPHEFRGR